MNLFYMGINAQLTILSSFYLNTICILPLLIRKPVNILKYFYTKNKEKTICGVVNKNKCTKRIKMSSA